MSTKSDRGRPPVRAVDRAIDLLMELTEGPQSLAALATSTGLSKATIHRLLATLTYRQLAMQDPQTGQYSLGRACFRFVEAISLGHNGVGVLARPVLERLRAETGETTTLHVRIAGQRICIEELPSSQAVRYTSARGETAPVHVGSAGKTLLAFLTDDERSQVLESLTLSPITESTYTDRDALLVELVRIRRQGWAVSRGERIVGAAAVSAPVFDNRRAPVAVVSALGPESRLNAQGLKTARPFVIAAAQALTDLLHARDSELEEVAEL